MTALDYFLYDNRTWAPRIGRDWGIKAATGVLATRADLRSIFERYCGSLPADQGYLHGFGQALGGIRAPGGHGYLLCATLETVDTFGRPSWAICGLWCDTATTLQNALVSDPVVSAQTVLRTDPPPVAITLRSPAFSLLPRRRRAIGKTTYRRFDRKSAIPEVISILLGAIRGNTEVPNVLGITASSRLPLLARTFDLIYCHPLDDRSERAFESHRSDAEPADEEWSDAAAAPSLERPSAPSSHSRALLWTACLVIAVATTVVFSSVVTEAWPWWMVHVPAFADPQPRTSTVSSELPVATSSPKSTLIQIRELLDEIEELDPEDLKADDGPPGDIGRTPLSSDRLKVRDAYMSLLEDRERIVGSTRGHLAYYYGEQQARSLSASARLQGVRSVLDERPLGQSACSTIRDVVGPEFDRATFPARRWCDSLAKLEGLASSLRGERHREGSQPVSSPSRRTGS